jgi:energy-coupling factor transporter ATP-binding protein EcfA2
MSMDTVTQVTENPFPGLRPFTRDETDLFFGRDHQSDELVGRLARARFLAVLGTSGSGKSSLVRAGLLPALDGGLMVEAGSLWLMATMRPQDDPIGFLARALVRGGVLTQLDLPDTAAVEIVETTLRRSSLGLVEIVRLGRLDPRVNLLVLVDQFEEIFRFADLARQRGTEDEAKAFVKLLLAAAQKSEVPLYVVITMRSDFLGDCDRFPGLPEAVTDSPYLTPRLTRDELQSAITGPVGVCGGRIAPTLVQRLLNDVGDDPDQLPILQHALMRAWDHGAHDTPESRELDVTDLDAIGGMAEALSRHAEEAYASLSERQQAIAERLFKCLT